MSVLNSLSPRAIKLANRPLHEHGALVVSSGTADSTLKLFAGLTAAQLFTLPIVDPTAAEAVLAGLWLGHDALEESHRISQSLETPSGSYWHAIMHRREGDFSNSKYWYARCLHHPAREASARRAANLAASAGFDPTGKRLVAANFDGPDLVDLVAAIYRRPADSKTEVAQRWQQIEWQTLFEFCVATAVGQKVLE